MNKRLCIDFYQHEIDATYNQVEQIPLTRDCFFTLNRRVRLATFEPLHWTHRTLMEQLYQHFGVKCHHDIYTNVRSLCWNQQLVDQSKMYHRNMSRSENNGRGLDETEIDERIQRNLANFYQQSAPTLECVTFAQHTHLPMAINFYPNPFVDMCSLRELTIDIGGVDSVWYKQSPEVIYQREPLYRLLNNRVQDSFDRRCETRLRKLHIDIENLEYQHIYLDRKVVFQFVNRFAGKLKSMSTDLWTIHRHFYDFFAPFGALRAYKVVFIPRKTMFITLPTTFLIWWTNFANHFASPSTIRSLTIVWYSILCLESLFQFFAILSRYCSLRELALTLSFKIDVENFSMETYMRTLESIEQNLIANNGHQWCFRSLSLTFSSTTLHRMEDEIDPQREAYFEPCCEYYRILTGPSAVELRSLWLSLTEKTVSLDIGAPYIHSISVDLEHWHEFPHTFRYPIFANFAHAETVEEICVKNFYYLINDQRQEVSAVQLEQIGEKYQQFFNHLLGTFPNVRRVQLCANQTIGGEGSTSSYDRFYLKFSSIIKTMIHHQSAKLCELLILDNHPKTCAFVAQLIEQFIRMAEQNRGQTYLLSLPNTDEVFRQQPRPQQPSPQRQDDDNDDDYEFDYNNNRIKRRRLMRMANDDDDDNDEYDQLRLYANRLRNLRLVIPDRVVYMRRMIV